MSRLAMTKRLPRRLRSLEHWGTSHQSELVWLADYEGLRAEQMAERRRQTMWLRVMGGVKLSCFALKVLFNDAADWGYIP